MICVGQVSGTNPAGMRDAKVMVSRWRHAVSIASRRIPSERLSFPFVGQQVRTASRISSCGQIGDNDQYINLGNDCNKDETWMPGFLISNPWHGLHKYRVCKRGLFLEFCHTRSTLVERLKVTLAYQAEAVYMPCSLTNMSEMGACTYTH